MDEILTHPDLFNITSPVIDQLNSKPMHERVHLTFDIALLFTRCFMQLTEGHRDIQVQYKQLLIAACNDLMDKAH